MNTRSQPDRGAALATLRWILGGEPVSADDFFRGYDALPYDLRPLAADFGLRHIECSDAERRERLAKVARRATMGWMARRTVVREIRSVLDGAEIPAVFLKGVALAEQVYPRPATRPSSDIDVWIRPDDLPAAIRGLARGGFAFPPDVADPSDPRGPAPTAQCEKRVAGVPVVVELHVRPLSLRDLTDEEVDSIWRSRVDVGPSGLPVLPLDAQLLHVCLHTARSHGFVGGLKVLVDTAMIVRAWPDADLWRAFASRARELRAERPVYVCLELARELLGVPVPPEVLEQLGSGADASVLDQARLLLWSREPKLPLGTVRLFGGGLPEPDWFRNRLRLRRFITPEQRRSMSPDERPAPQLVARFFWRRLSSLARSVLGGEVFTRSFWERVNTERKRARLLRDLYGGQTGPPSSRSIET